jgi:hypothetical protein
MTTLLTKYLGEWTMRRHALPIALIITIATAFLSGCPVQTKRVLVIGDSISFESAGDINRIGSSVSDTEPVNRMTFTILATVGVGARRTVGTPSNPDKYWSGLIANSIYGGDFDAIVVQLGTNDCSYLSVNGDYQRDIKRVVRRISRADPDVPIFWLTMQQHPYYPDCASIINSDLQQVVESRAFPRLTILDYGRWAERHPECFIDQIHPRESWHKDPTSGGTTEPAPAGYCEGQLQYAGWLKAQLDDHFGPPVVQ